MGLAIGVDIGGTKIDFVLVNATGEILQEYRLPTAPEEGSAAVFQRLAQGIDHLLAQAPVEGIGIGCPGLVDPHGGIVRLAVNLGWRDVPLRTTLQQRFDLPIYVQNDVNAAAIGEHVFGAAKNCTDFAYLAVGTGLGGAAVIHNQIVNGISSFAMEIGHLSLDLNGRLCKCGQRGCIEQYISGVGLLAAIEEHGAQYPESRLHQTEISTTAILEAARQGDPLALNILTEAGCWLGRAMACCASIFNPPLIVLGGGLGLAAAEWLFPPAMTELRQRVLSHVYDHLTVVNSTVPRIAVGAAAQVFIK